MKVLGVHIWDIRKRKAIIAKNWSPKTGNTLLSERML